MAAYTKSEIVSGVFVTAAIVVFALFSFRVTEFDLTKLYGPKPVLYAAEFSDVKGLSQGAGVSVAGLEVGEVTRLEISQAPLSENDAQRLIETFGDVAYSTIAAGMTRQVVRVEFHIRHSELRIDASTATVRIAQDGFFGDNYISLDAGYWEEGSPIEPTDQPIAIRALDSAGMVELFTQLQPVIRKLNSMMAKVDHRLLTSRNLDRIADTISGLDEAIADVRSFFDKENTDGMHQMLVDPANKVLENADETLTTLRESYVNEIEDRVKTIFDEGSAALASAQEVTQAVEDLIADNRANIDSFVAQLNDTATDLDGYLAQLTAEAQEALKLGSGMLAENRPEVAETIRRLRRTMWQAEMAMRKIRANPAFLLFGDSESILEESSLDETGNRTTGRVRPYMQRDENDDGG